MAILPIRIWGDPVLTKRAAAVSRITRAERELIEDLKETMAAADGAGLAAPQVGVSKRIFTFRIGEEVHVLINPRITKRDGEIVGVEGCLSIPGVQAEVARAEYVVITGKDENGKTVTYRLEDSEETGRAGTCVQHELDHLNGDLYIEKAEPDTLSWLIEDEDEMGEPEIALLEATPEEILKAYRTKRLPPKVHISEMLRKRVERD
ncbi:MAG: peptide deformylase [Abditibacteriaceae bacterium]